MASEGNFSNLGDGVINSRGDTSLLERFCYQAIVFFFHYFHYCTGVNAHLASPINAVGISGYITKLSDPPLQE
jgi:hypothetical protein